MPNVFETSDAAAGTSTVYSLTSGQTAQGTLGVAGDHDWYRVDLVAGQTYAFAMTGAGVYNVQDTFLRLYGPGGATLVASNDDSLQGHNSIFTYTAATTGSYYLDAAAYSAGDTGQYGVSFTAGTRASFDLQMGAGVIDTDLDWNAAPGTGANVTYGYRLSNNGAESTFSQVTAAQIAAIESILQLYSEVCGLTFTRTNPNGYTDDATILFADYSANDGAGAYAYYPGSTSSSSYAGDVWLNTSVSNTSLPTGGYSYFAIMHELGHAVGLSHPGTYNAGVGVSITYTNNAQFTQDTHQYSVMSYFDESNTTSSYGSYPDTLMLHDIYALQQIYGSNLSTRSTDTVYGFNGNAGGVYNFGTNTSPALCIWDGGGIDTLNVSDYSQNQLVNLSGGAFSNIGGLTGNVSIAYGATIENAVCGSGGDSIYLYAGSVNNSVDGGGGTDTVYVTYAYGSGYTLAGTAANLVMTGVAGADIFLNVEYVRFSDGALLATSALLSTPPESNFLSISDVTVTEGDSGTQLATFTVTRSGGTAALSVNYATANGSATAGSDYTAASGTLSFGTGVNTMTFQVTIAGDTTYEANETFFVNLSGATNGATISDNQAQGTIANNDAPSGVTINGTSAANVIDVTHGIGGVFATEYADTINGLGGNDNISGLGGNDTISGGSGNDILSGGAGNDALTGGSGTDSVSGGEGNDTIIISGSGDQSDTLLGGNGTDTILVAGTGSVSLAGFNASTSSIEIWQGNDMAVLGNSSSNVFDFSGLVQAPTGISYADGAGGNDRLIGSNFADALRGGYGADVINGSMGNDLLGGGSGSDRFVFDTGFGNDTITDFAAGSTGSDVIDFQASVFANFAAVQAAMLQFDADADGVADDTLITVNGSNTVTLLNVANALLVANDFDLV